VSYAFFVEILGTVLDRYSVKVAPDPPPRRDRQGEEFSRGEVTTDNNPVPFCGWSSRTDAWVCNWQKERVLLDHDPPSNQKRKNITQNHVFLEFFFGPIHVPVKPDISTYTGKGPGSAIRNK
jgi:hypothetical protein